MVIFIKAGFHKDTINQQKNCTFEPYTFDDYVERIVSKIIHTSIATEF